MIRFGIEETGRYGGIGIWAEQQIEVRCVDSNDVLRRIIAKHGRIDVLKVDIEGLESEVVTRIPRPLRAKISKIYAECRFSDNPMAGTHSYRQDGYIARFCETRRYVKGCCSKMKVIRGWARRGRYRNQLTGIRSVVCAAPHPN
jgi:hypothetical protein